MNAKEVIHLVENSSHPFVSGLIGENPSTYSMSRVMWNSAFAFHGISSEYVPFDIPKENISEVLDALISHHRISGFNVTNPYKELAARHKPIVVDQEALMGGGINTVHRLEGKVLGHSTDGHGAIKSIEEKCGDVFVGNNVVVLGAGGSGSAIAAACLKKGANVCVANRTLMNAVDLLERAAIADYTMEAIKLYDRDEKSYNPNVLEILKNAGIIINTIPTEKTTGNPLFADGELKGKKKICMDIVYGHKSHFLEAAKKEGHTAIDGRWMLLHQAVKAFEHIYHEDMRGHHLSWKDIEAPMRYAVTNFKFDESNESIERKIRESRKEIH